jgi:hypothetical protein
MSKVDDKWIDNSATYAIIAGKKNYLIYNENEVKEVKDLFDKHKITAVFDQVIDIISLD